MSITRLLPRLLLALLVPAAASTASEQADSLSQNASGDPIQREHALPSRPLARHIGAGAPGEPARREPFNPRPQPGVPRWLKEVRAQRHALQEQRRAAHQARHEALDPIGAAKREERQEQLQRRRREVRDFLEHERRLYLNWGPWIMPLVPRPSTAPGIDPLAEGSIGSRIDENATSQPDARDGAKVPAPSDWDNRWYFHGW